MSTLSQPIARPIQAGRATGKYKLVDLSLTEVPPELWDANLPLPSAPGKASSNAAAQDAKWWEVCEPSRMELSRNKLTSIPDGLCNLETLTALDLSYNQLTALPPSLARLSRLCTLHVQQNTLRILPPLPSSLVVLNAATNKICELHPSMGALTALTSLELSHNALAVVDEQAAAGWASLQECKIAHNQLTYLPHSVGRLNKLVALHATANRITEVPPSIAGCSKLVELHLGGNALQRLPAELSACTNLKVLVANDNSRLREIAPQMCSLQLSTLDLRCCDLASLPPQLGLMTSLRALLLDGNGLRAIRRPLITGPVSELLTYLASRITEQPPQPQAPASSAARHVGHTFKLGLQSGQQESANVLAHTMAAGLRLDQQQHHQHHHRHQQQWQPQVQPHQQWQSQYQQSSAYPLAHQGQAPAPQYSSQAGGAVAGVYGRPSIDSSTPGGGRARHAPVGPVAIGTGGEVILAKAGLCEVPRQVFESGAITLLDLSDNQLGFVPHEGLARLTGLRVLKLARAGLTVWPLPPVLMPELRQLVLAGNSGLRMLPPGALMPCAATLTLLDLSGVPGAPSLRPEDLAACQRLEHCDLSRTGSSQFPDGVLALGPTLRTLNLSDNGIQGVPPMIMCMTKLVELRLDNNALTNLPAELGLLARDARGSLVTLSIGGNPIRAIRRPLLDRGGDSLLEYLRGRLAQ